MTTTRAPAAATAEAQDRRVVVGAVLATAALLPLVAAGGALAAGWAGVRAGVAGVVLTASFFAVTVVALGWARRAGVVGLAGVVLGTYTAKVVALGLVFWALSGTDVLHRETFAVSVALGVVVYLAAEVRLALTGRVPYVEPFPAPPPAPEHPS